MNTRTLLSLGVVALAVLAGCNTAPMDSEPVYGPSTTMPDVLDGHQQTIESSDSFRYNASTSISARDGSDQQPSQNVTARVNTATGALYVRQRLGDRAVVEGYSDGNGTAVRRVSAQGQSRVETVAADDVNVTGYVRPNLDGQFDGLNYTHRGTVERDGQLLHNYTVTSDGLGLAQPRTVGPFSSSDVTHVESRLLVTDDGVVRSLTTRLTGQVNENTTYVYTLDIGYDGVGSTTVTEPAWASQAADDADG
jgi:hypothetical protein